MNKKRKNLLNVLFEIVVIILVIVGVIAIRKKDSENKFIVCIDAGHGGSDSGATLDKRNEKDDNLEVARLVQKYLEEKDIEVVMTRSKDNYVSLKDRCKIANKSKADLFVSIHRNSAELGNGVELWINSNESDENLKLANSIWEELQETQIQNERGVKSGTINGNNTDYYVLNNTKMPSCLIELGFITDKKDNKLFDENIQNYAKAIADGIEKLKDK